MKILITGGAGFIGSHTAERFLEEGNQVALFDNLSTGSLDNVKYLKKKFNDKVEFVKGDVRKAGDFKKLPKDIDLIVHLAAIVSVPQSIENPEESNLVTLGGTVNVFEFAKKHGIQKVIQASSAAVYGDVKKVPIKEEYAGNFISPYAISKFGSEIYAGYYERVFGIKTVSLRFFNVYGERQRFNSPYSGVIAIFVESFQKKIGLNIYGNGEKVRDFIYVKDVAAVISNCAARKTFKSGIYNLGTGRGVSIMNMVKTLEKIFGYKVPIAKLKERKGDIKKSVADISRIKKDLNFKPMHNLEEGLRLMLKK